MEHSSDPSQDNMALTQSFHDTSGDDQDSVQSLGDKETDAPLKRSVSTPNTESLVHKSGQDSKSSGGISGDKKRNKLGYHRTSIACSHCRRRKIRCLTSSEVQNRCVNCVRLKKECSFYPVDQQPGMEELPNLHSQSSTVSSIPSESSSPGIGSPAEMPIHHQPYIPMTVAPLPSMAPISMQPPGEDYFGQDGKVSMNGISSNNHYDLGTQPATGWVPDGIGLEPMSRPEDIHAAWRSYTAESPVSAQFSPYSHTSAASATWTSGPSESGSHDNFAWSDFPPATRSMSYSGEGAASLQQAQYMAITQNQSFTRRPSNFSDPYSPNLGLPVGGMGGHMGQLVDPLASLAGVAVPQHNHGIWHPQVIPQGQSPYVKQTEGFGGWEFGGTGGSDQV